MDHSSTDRRAHPRFDREVEIEGNDGSEPVAARLISRNLSIGGASCTSTEDIPEMTRLSVRLMLPRTAQPGASVEPLDVEAVVVRKQPIESPSGGGDRFELALLFTGLRREHKERLRAYLGAPDPDAH